MTTIRNARLSVEAFYARYRLRLQIAAGVALTLISALAIVSAIVLHSTRIQASTLSIEQCQRSREFGPELVKFYAAYHVLTADSLHLYQQTIPKHC